MKYYPYEDFKNDTHILIEKVKADKYEMIIGIARGGLTLAHAMAEGLNIRNVQTMRTELYDATSKREHMSIFGACEFQDIKKVLVVDDIADSGETLDAMMKLLESQNPQINFKSATLFYKTTSVYEPHFWVNEATEWIDFFWERDFK